MGDQPSTVNQPAKTVSDIINTVIFKLALNASEKGLEADFPFLKLPIISSVFDVLMRYLATRLFDALSQAATFEIIDLQTTAEKNAYAKAEEALHAAHLSGDPNALQAATADFERTLGALIHFDGSNPV